MHVLFTIGYEGRDVEGLVDRLRKNGVHYVVDVRANPVSRKKGFSKSQLAIAVESEGMEYVHVADVGAPKILRDRVRDTGDYESFFEAYSSHLTECQDALQMLEDLVKRGPACLLCLERMPERCHRQVLADNLCQRRDLDIKVRHI